MGARSWTMPIAAELRQVARFCHPRESGDPAARPRCAGASQGIVGGRRVAANRDGHLASLILAFARMTRVRARRSLVAARLPITLNKNFRQRPPERTAELAIGGRFRLLETAPDRIRRESTLILWKVGS
jgi:hypothetical protein